MAQQTAIPALPEDTWVDGREPVIFIAEPSTGKTMLATALATGARRVRSTILAALQGPAHTASSDAMSAATLRTELVVLDELEYLARRDRTTSRSFLHVVFERNGRQSLIYTMNLPIRRVDQRVRQPRLATIVVDPHRTREHPIDTGSESWRVRHGLDGENQQEHITALGSPGAHASCPPGGLHATPTSDNDRREPRPVHSIAPNRLIVSHSNAAGKRRRERRLQSRRRGVATRTVFGSPEARRVRQRRAPRWRANDPPCQDWRATDRRSTMTPESELRDGELAAKISRTVVRALSRTTGRGPTKAKTTLGANGVFVVLQDTLTRGEQTLADAGQGEAVLDLRHRWQMVMKNDVSREIEELTGRKVIGFMSDNHIDPDLAVEVFVLEPRPSTDTH